MTALAPPPIGKSAHQIANMQLVPRRHYGRMVASVVIIVLLLAFIRARSNGLTCGSF